MMPLKAWINQEGRRGRRLLFEAIKASYPSFTQVSLTNYILGQRIPDFDVAKIISKVTGIPIFLLPFRFVHKPNLYELRVNDEPNLNRVIGKKGEGKI
jgi:hypothetical protein